MHTLCWHKSERKWASERYTLLKSNRVNGHTVNTGMNVLLKQCWKWVASATAVADTRNNQQQVCDVWWFGFAAQLAETNNYKITSCRSTKSNRPAVQPFRKRKTTENTSVVYLQAATGPLMRVERLIRQWLLLNQHHSRLPLALADGLNFCIESYICIVHIAQSWLINHLL